MASPSTCKLCLRSCRANSEVLVDKRNHKTKKYRTVKKYFDRKFLDSKQRQDLTKICSICWRQISDFYYFQEFILRTGRNPHDELNQEQSRDGLMEKRCNDNEDIDFESEDIEQIFSELDSIDIRFSSNENLSLREPPIQEHKSDEMSVPAYDVEYAIYSNLDSITQQLASTKNPDDQVFLKKQIEENLNLFKGRGISQNNNENQSYIECIELGNISKILKKNPKYQSNEILLPNHDVPKRISQNLNSLRQQLESAQTEADKTFLNKQIDDNLNLLRERRKRIRRLKQRTPRLMQEIIARAINFEM